MKKLLLLFLTVFVLGTAEGQQAATLSGQIKNPKQQALKLVLQRNPILRDAVTRHIALEGDLFKHEIPVSKPVFAYLTDGKNFVQLLLEPGDDIVIRYNADSLKETFSLSGRGSEKINLLRAITSHTLNDLIKAKAPVARTQKLPFDYLLHAIDSTANRWRSQLQSLRTRFSAESYQLLDAEIKALVMSSQYRCVGWIHHESITQTLTNRAAELTPASKRTIESLLSFDETLFFSPAYLNAVYTMLFMDYDARQLSGKTNESFVEKYAYLNTRLGPKLKVPVLTLFLESDISKLNPAEDLSAIIAETYPEESDYKTYITNYHRDRKTFRKGSSAPAFTLENANGEKVTLESFKGKVVYLDFWFAACGPCHALFKTTKPVKEHFRNNKDVVFLCVSIDSKEVWEAALKKYDIDGYHAFTEGKGGNHPVITDYRVYGYPTTCLIDRSGKIINPSPSIDPEELKLQIEAALK
jgi:cytochrome oxidase Cu insertion factor (SCO1/SenC/PrrC family)